MSNEVNETLVMTTCKCRENDKNIVMTRTWFNETLRNKIDEGVRLENQRIISLLENSTTNISSTNDLINIIKGETDVGN
jgi:hypothetical protein